MELASTGREALEKAAAGKYDLLIMDVQMPIMDGLEATAAIRASGNPVPILALTAHALDCHRERCLSSGMNGYICKPIRGHDLERAIDRLLPVVG